MRNKELPSVKISVFAVEGNQMLFVPLKLS